MIFLFTDFGASDIYIGQVRAVLHQYAPDAHVVDLLHEAPAFNVRTSAHLFAALAARPPAGSVTLAVVDPCVGGPRTAMEVLADGRWFKPQGTDFIKRPDYQHLVVIVGIKAVI